MENKFRIMLLSMATVGLFSCSDKLADDGSGTGKFDGNENSVYMTVAVALPSASMRSATDEPTGNGNDQTNSNEDDKGNPDYEYGYASENNVNTMLLVLAGTDGSYITHAAISGIMQSPVDVMNKNFDFTVKEKFARKDIDDAYENKVIVGNGSTVNVYVFCNYTANLLKKFEDLRANGGKENKPGDWMHWTGSVIEDAAPAGKKPSVTSSIWTPHSFLMSNAKTAKVTFPATKEEWDNYTREDSPFHLSGNLEADGKVKEGEEYINPIYVERAAARIDYKQYVDEDANIKDNTYPLWTTITAAGGTTQNINLISVELTRMALVNMSNKFHYLRHVSNDGTDTDWKTCEPETPRNYVVDTDWKVKQGKGSGTNDEPKAIDRTNAKNYFNFPLFAENEEDGYNIEGWYVDNINDVLNNTNDTWLDKKYHIWRYVTENTIPQAPDGEDPHSLQKTVQSIGVVFKGSIILGEDGNKDEFKENISDEVKTALDHAKKHTVKKGSGVNESTASDAYDYPTLYFYNNKLFAGLKGLLAEATVSAGNPLNSALADVFSHWIKKGSSYEYRDEPADEDEDCLTVEDVSKDPSLMSETDPNFKYQITKVKKITIYEPSYEETGNDPNGKGWGYYCYYFYWNRHNDNGNNSKMGQMEFATVRNNVYKLQVTKIGELGHPRKPDNDPDPVDPEDPDEEDKVYMDVKVEVLPWVVRVNDIEF